MSEPVFATIEVALAASYAAQVSAAYPKSSTQVVIEDLMRSSGKVFDTNYIKNVNAAGLAPLQFFAQCARVRQITEYESNLMLLEKHVILARYSCTNDRRKGWEVIAENVEEKTRNKGCCLVDIIRSVFTPTLTIRSISDAYDIKKNSIESDLSYIKGFIHALEKPAILKAESKLREKGLVGDLLLINA